MRIYDDTPRSSEKQKSTFLFSLKKILHHFIEIFLFSINYLNWQLNLLNLDKQSFLSLKKEKKRACESF